MTITTWLTELQFSEVEEICLDIQEFISSGEHTKAEYFKLVEKTCLKGKNLPREITQELVRFIIRDVRDYIIRKVVSDADGKLDDGTAKLELATKFKSFVDREVKSLYHE